MPQQNYQSKNYVHYRSSSSNIANSGTEHDTPRPQQQHSPHKSRRRSWRNSNYEDKPVQLRKLNKSLGGNRVEIDELKKLVQDLSLEVSQLKDIVKQLQSTSSSSAALTYSSSRPNNSSTINNNNNNSNTSTHKADKEQTNESSDQQHLQQERGGRFAKNQLRRAKSLTKKQQWRNEKRERAERADRGERTERGERIERSEREPPKKQVVENVPAAAVQLMEDFLELSKPISVFRRSLNSFEDVVVAEFVKSFLENAIVNVSSPQELTNLGTKLCKLMFSEEKYNRPALHKNFYKGVHEVSNREAQIFIDSPRYIEKLGTLLSEIAVTLFKKKKELCKKFLTEIADAFHQEGKGPLLANIVRAVAEAKDEDLATDLWTSSGLNWLSFIEDNSVLIDFLKSYQVNFLTAAKNQQDEQKGGDKPSVPQQDVVA